MSNAAVGSREHYELLEAFERDNTGHRSRRLDREDRSMWARGNVYQDGAVNELFRAYQSGYAFGRAVERGGA